MKHRLLIFFPLFFVAILGAQNGYMGATVDFNTGIGDRYTYGLGVHMERRIFNNDNLYFNWHYSIGVNRHSELHAHGSVPLLLYGHRGWWNFRSMTWGEMTAVVLGPLICPGGITWYPVRTSNDARLGVYCNPLAMDFFSQQPVKVISWTVESGAKCLIPVADDYVLYCAAGVALTNNIRRSAGGYGNESLLQLQLGMMKVSD